MPFLVSCAVCFLSATGPSAQAADQISGEWKINANNYSGRLELSSGGGLYSGRIFIDAEKHWENLTNIRFEPGSRTIEFDLPEANQHYVGRLVADNRMEGTFTGSHGLSAELTEPDADPDRRADHLVSRMTMAEKVQLVHGACEYSYGVCPGTANGAGGFVPGIPRLHIPDLYLADGSVGVGDGVGPATALPSSIASAASWDVNEAYKYGQVIGRDLRAYGMNVHLGGNTNLIGREPRDGRTFETKGEDPILAGKITAAHIRAVQDQHVVGGIKHFALNDQETGRFLANVLIDDRSARESDLLAFEIGVKDSGVQSVMCSYNLVNGTYACENPYLLSTVLKGDWRFPGFVMSDWGATHSTAPAANAGLDQEQANSAYFGDLQSAVESGQVPLSRLDNMVHRILRAMFAVGLFDYPASPHPIDVAADDAIAQEVEEQGAVLLQNNGVLPLNGSALGSIAVIGLHADIAVLSGGGSAQVYPNGGAALPPPYVYPWPPGWAPVIWDPSSPVAAIQAKAPGASVQFNDGKDSGAAAALAASSDVAIVFVNQWTSEGMDLLNLYFGDWVEPPPWMNQDILVGAVAAANRNTIVVMENGGAQVMPWLSNVAAVLEAWYPGERGGPAIANILFGTVNPSGKLPITFPASVNDLPRPTIYDWPNPTSQFNVDYTIDGFNVGYKWFDVNGLNVEFPFGFGLSYTTFSISDARLTTDLSSSGWEWERERAHEGRRFQVSFDLTNTGSVAGAEVAQVYLGLPAAMAEPPKRLVGWHKVLLRPGETRAVTIEVDENDSSHPLSYWDVHSHDWQVANGDYSVYLGNSSRNVTMVGTFHVGP
jgi:beta-glucosidase